MSRRHAVHVIALVTFALLVPAGAAPSMTMSAADKLHSDMRKLWEDHITWTRLYIVSVAAGLPDKDATAQRLIQNQVDIGNAIKPYYGDAAGTKLTELLKEHILGAADLLAAAKAGNQAEVAKQKARWSKNADDIAVFLSGANPKNWPEATMKAEMKMHLDLTLKEALDRFGGKYADDIKDYDDVHAHILKLADTLTNGITGPVPGQVQVVGAAGPGGAGNGPAGTMM
jgi:hypothetical protein